MNNPARIGGVSLILFVLCFFASFALEGVRESLGFPDADNPEVMMRFLNERIDIFTYSGILYVSMGVLLTFAALSVWETVGLEVRPLIFKFGTLFAVFAAAYFFVNGILRIQSPGTLLHMDNLNHDWGLAGYLAVQMVGTQGFGSAGGFAVGIWVFSLSMFNFRAKFFWKGLSWLGLAAIVPLFIGFFAPVLPSTDMLYFVYILGLLTIFVWCLLFGISLLLKKDTAGAK
jgi:hypothetical protein